MTPRRSAETEPPSPESPCSLFVAELAETRYALPDTLIRRFMHYGKNNCRCKADPPGLHGPYCRWPRTVAGKTVTRTLTPDQAASYQPRFDNARHLREQFGDLKTRSLQAFDDAERPDRKS